MTPAEFSAITFEKTHLYNENVISSIKYLQTFWEKCTELDCEEIIIIITIIS